jgi:PII-like signaling protein
MEDATLVEDGALRIYLYANERFAESNSRWRRWNRSQTCRQIVRWAHDAGLASASVYRSGLGFIGRNPVVDEADGEMPHSSLIVCVEILGRRDELKVFADRHAHALRNAIVEYYAVERWSVPRHRSNTVRHESPPTAHHAVAHASHRKP